MRVSDAAIDLENAAAKVTEVIDTTVTTSKAAHLTVGDEVAFTKGGMSGY